MTLSHYIGVDIAKNWIDIYDPETHSAERISTTSKALSNFARKLNHSIVVFEASGGYERPLADALAATDVAYVRVNPRQSREFARATGHLAKTDKVDAKVLAHMGAALCLTPTPHPDKTRAELADMMARREDIKAMMRAENNRRAQARLTCIKRDIKSVLGHLAKRLAKLEERIDQHVQAHEALLRESRCLQTMPGIGPILSAALIANLPELGQMDRREIAALSGLAPHARDSGLFKGKRRIWGGRANVRRTLYLAAFIASRYDPTLRSFRKRLEANGKPPKVAIVATARKLVTILNAMMKNNCDYRKPMQN
jgi:transposase